jgi:hypothetical protein
MKDPNSNQTMLPTSTVTVGRKPIQRWHAAQERRPFRDCCGANRSRPSRASEVELYRLPWQTQTAHDLRSRVSFGSGFARSVLRV